MVHNYEIWAMQILLAAATALEIAPFVKSNPSADILVTGVGAPATIYHLAKRIQLIDYDLVIQAGIAGSFIPDMELGKTVMVGEDTFADAGIKTRDGFATIFEAALADPNQFPYSNGWLVNSGVIADNLPYEKLRAVTSNTITDNSEDISQIYAKYKAAIESMEGAALHYVCLQEEVPFLQLRSVSNYVGERDKSKWKMKLAIGNLNEELQMIYEKLLNLKN